MRICVFGGSSAGTGEQHVEAARELGARLVRRRIGLVYGGAKVGLMGALADTVREQGGEIRWRDPAPARRAGDCARRPG
jgi:predicted Rossmann-fold nucleotide-binding protein